ncbi:MAG: bifunctional UDP-N-acetylglucosamine diphosphorylase/glucosamine-1-phosphate N-acetyltransferase GlmU [Clostridia bacterium]|nr:bifunctional UDP-N-acetylglucosamine diphosphorylase/glucosamine-1-phosphate N-acetyltransferase GlmU [Clostridia bacterium]
MTNFDIAIIMAGGTAISPNSTTPRVMATVMGKPMIGRVTDAAVAAKLLHIVAVVPENDTTIKDYLVKEHPGSFISAVEQEKPLGTAHAVMQAERFIHSCAEHGGNVLILNGDTPFMDANTICSSYAHHISESNDLTVITANLDKPFGYGRIVRGAERQFMGIVEEHDANPIVKRINEISSGTFWVNAEKLLLGLNKLQPRQNGHYNLVDLVSMFIEDGNKTDTYFAPSSDIILGANSRLQLMELNQYGKMQQIEYHLANGVDIPFSDGVIIEPGVEIGADTQILPNTIIQGNTKIGKGCVIGPNSIIRDSVIEDGAKLNNVQCYQSRVLQNADIGPFVHIRPNSVIGEKVHLGNFVEVKNSSIDTGTKVSHLTYVGDSDVGKRVNFGCGTVTVNYTGKAKFRTTIGDDAFIGCNTNLVAPVKVGDGAYTAAGSTITEDVPADALGIARARQVNKINWKLK